MTNKEGSGLILAIMIVLNALLIISSIGAVAVIQKKAASKQKNAPTAYQIADGGLEWTLNKVKGQALFTLGAIFGDKIHQGIVDCSFLFSNNLKSNSDFSCRVYFLRQSGPGHEIINVNNTQLSEVEKIRAIGEYKKGNDWTRRGVEVNFSIN